MYINKYLLTLTCHILGNMTLVQQPLMNGLLYLVQQRGGDRIERLSPWLARHRHY